MGASNWLLVVGLLWLSPPARAHNAKQRARVSTIKLAAISLVDHAKPNSGVRAVVGRVEKHPANPLLVQDTPWELRIDNGYPNILRTPSGTWELFYGTCFDGCHKQVLLYANSTDGLRWRKPSLGLFDAGAVDPTLKHVGKANNMVLEGGGIGVIRDETAAPSQRYVAFGPGCYTHADDGSCSLSWARDVKGGALRVQYPSQDLAFSTDGLTYGDARSIMWPSPQRWDCHNNLVHESTADHQAPLAASSSSSSVRSPTARRWLATTRDGFSGPIGRAIGIASSLGDTLQFNTTMAPANTLSGNADFQLYSQITFRWNNVYLGIVMVYEETSVKQRVRCRLAWAPADGVASEGAWQWVDAAGLQGAELIPLGAGGSETFDSHICFAAARPVSLGGRELLYYMGGNGPHSGARNSSLGLATLRADGFAALASYGPPGAGAGAVRTIPLLVTGGTLRATVDVAEGGEVHIGCPAVASLDAGLAMPITRNVTDAPIQYESGADFSQLVGSMVVLELRIKKASIYTVSFV